MLIERGAITGEQLLRAIESQQTVGGRIGTCLLEMDVLTEETLLATLSDQLAVPSVPPAGLRQIDGQVLSLVSSKIAKKCRAVPFASSNGDVQVAILDVKDLATLDELSFFTSKRVRPFIANEVRIFQALEEHYGQICPPRYTHLLGRLEGQSYEWQEGALLSDGPQSLSSSSSWSSRSAAPPDLDRVLSVEEVAQAAQAIEVEAPPSPSVTSSIEATSSPRTFEDTEAEATSDADFGTAAVDLLVARQADSEVSDSTSGTSEVIDTSEHEADDVSLDASAMATARRPPSPFDDIERLLEHQSDREVIGQILLRTLGAAFGRCALFKVHRGLLRGWLARGGDFDLQLFRELELSIEDSSVFRHLQQGSEIYIGPLPRSPSHRRMACTWGGDLPKDCLMMPIRVRDHMVSVVYVDNEVEGLLQPDVDGLRRLVERASLAFEWCILRKKSQQHERGR